MAKRRHEQDNHYHPAKYPRYDNDYPPLERDFYSLPVNDTRKHPYHLRPREHYRYYGRVPPLAPYLANPGPQGAEKERNAHSYTVNGHRYSNSSTASTRKRRLMTLKEEVDCGLRRRLTAASGAGDDRGHVS